MFTKAEFLTGLPSTVRRLCPTGETLPPAADLLTALIAEDGCFEISADGIWFACGNEDFYYPYAGAATASDCLAALVTLYERWGITYTAATGFSG